MRHQRHEQSAASLKVYVANHGIDSPIHINHQRKLEEFAIKFLKVAL